MTRTAKKSIQTAQVNTKKSFFSLPREMNTFIDNFLDGNHHFVNPFSADSWPHVEVKEDDKEYKIKAEIPGVKAEKVSLSLLDNSIEISGERRKEEKQEKSGTFYSELNYGKFYRKIPLEREIDKEKVKAKIKDGVLNITIAKTQEDHRTKIDIIH